MKERMDLRIHQWDKHECNIEWPREAAYGSVLIARTGRRIHAFLVADSKPIAAYELRAEDVPEFHAISAKHWYDNERIGSFSVLSGNVSKGGIVRPLPPPPPFPIGLPRALLSQSAQLCHAATSQFESIAGCLVPENDT